MAKKKNTLKELRLVARDFSTLTAAEANSMDRDELVDFLRDQLAEMRKEPQAKKILASILAGEHTPLTYKQIANAHKLPLQVIRAEAELWGLQDTENMTTTEMVEYIQDCAALEDFAG